MTVTLRHMFSTWLCYTVGLGQNMFFAEHRNMVCCGNCIVSENIIAIPFTYRTLICFLCSTVYIVNNGREERAALYT